MSSAVDLAEQILLTPAELAAALAEHERRAAVLALAVASVDDRGEWAADGSLTMRAWLRDTCRMSDDLARGWLRRGRLLDHHEAFAEAAINGDLSSGQLAPLERLDSPKYRSLLHEHSRPLVGELSKLSAADGAVACTLWRQRADALLDDGTPPLEPVRELHQSRAGDGTLLGRFTLDDAAATEWEAATRTALHWEGSDDARTHAERLGDAMFDIAAFYNKNHDRDGNPRHVPHVGISVDAATLGDHPLGVNDDTQEPLSPACTDAHLCDCKLHTILRDAHGAPEAFGRTTYTVPRRLFRQVAARDGGCRFPGCHRKVRHCEAHHIRYWRHRGTTDYDNLVLLCSRHHHLVHHQRLHLKLLPHGELHVTWSDGRERVSTPRGAPPRRRC